MSAAWDSLIFFFFSFLCHGNNFSSFSEGSKVCRPLFLWNIDFKVCCLTFFQWFNKETNCWFRDTILSYFRTNTTGPDLFSHLITKFFIMLFIRWSPKKGADTWTDVLAWEFNLNSLIRNVNTIFYTLEVCNKIIDFYLVDKKFVGKKWQNTVLKIDETFNLRNILTDET